MRINRGFLIVFLVLCVSFLFLSSAWAKVYHFNYATFMPPTHHQSKLTEAWCKEIEKRTNGRVKFTYYPAGTLVKAAQIYDGIITGRVDVGTSCLLYTRGRFPLMDVINLPFGNPSGEFATAIINEIYDKFKPKELSDTQIMYLYAHGPGLIHTRNKPVHRLEDLKGLKIRSPGSVAEMLKALGASPLSMPIPEVYQALQRGVVDGAVYPIEGNKAWKFAEVVKYSIVCYPIAYSVGFFVAMNKEKWNELPNDIKKIILEVNREWIIKHGKDWDRADYEGLRYTLAHGNRIIGISPKEAKRWKKRIKVVFDKYVQSTEKKGLPGKKVLNFLRKRLNDYLKGKFNSKYIAR